MKLACVGLFTASVFACARPVATTTPPATGATTPAEATTAPAGVVMLKPAKDESTLERDVQKYLESRSIKSRYEEQNNDGVLHIGFEGDDSTWTFRVDTSDSGPGERVLHIMVRGGLYIDTARQGDLARAIINKHHIEYWAGTFRVDDDGEILGVWALNVPSANGIPAYMVDDVMSRFSDGWVLLRKALLDAGVLNISLDGQPPTPAAP